MYQESIRPRAEQRPNHPPSHEQGDRSNASHEASGRASLVLYLLTLVLLVGALAAWADTASRGRITPPTGAAREDDLGRSGRRW